MIKILFFLSSTLNKYLNLHLSNHYKTINKNKINKLKNNKKKTS